VCALPIRFWYKFLERVSCTSIRTSLLKRFACSDTSEGQDDRIPLDVVRSHGRFGSHRLGAESDAAVPLANSDADDDDDRDQDLEPFWQQLNNDRRNSRARTRHV